MLNHIAINETPFDFQRESLKMHHNSSMHVCVRARLFVCTHVRENESNSHLFLKAKKKNKGKETRREYQKQNK